MPEISEDANVDAEMLPGKVNIIAKILAKVGTK